MQIVDSYLNPSINFSTQDTPEVASSKATVMSREGK